MTYEQLLEEITRVYSVPWSRYSVECFSFNQGMIFACEINGYITKEQSAKLSKINIDMCPVEEKIPSKQE